MSKRKFNNYSEAFGADRHKSLIIRERLLNYGPDLNQKYSCDTGPCDGEYIFGAVVQRKAQIILDECNRVHKRAYLLEDFVSPRPLYHFYFQWFRRIRAVEAEKSATNGISNQSAPSQVVVTSDKLEPESEEDDSVEIIVFCGDGSPDAVANETVEIVVIARDFEEDPQEPTSTTMVCGDVMDEERLTEEIPADESVVMYDPVANDSVDSNYFEADEDKTNEQDSDQDPSAYLRRLNEGLPLRGSRITETDLVSQTGVTVIEFKLLADIVAQRTPLEEFGPLSIEVAMFCAMHHLHRGTTPEDLSFFLMIPPCSKQIALILEQELFV